MLTNMQTFWLWRAVGQSQNEKRVNNVFNYVIFLDDWIPICFHQFDRYSTLIYGLIKTIHYLNIRWHLFRSNFNWACIVHRQYQFSALGSWCELANKNLMNWSLYISGLLISIIVQPCYLHVSLHGTTWIWYSRARFVGNCQFRILKLPFDCAGHQQF